MNVDEQPTMDSGDTQGESSFDRFDREYTELELPDRLQWLETNLGVGRGKLVRLMNIPGEEAAVLQAKDWTEIAARFENEAEDLEGMLTQHLMFFDYDTKKAEGFTKDFAKRVDTGDLDLKTMFPEFASDISTPKEEAILIGNIRLQTRLRFPAMARYLSLKENAV